MSPVSNAWIVVGRLCHVGGRLCRGDDPTHFRFVAIRYGRCGSPVAMLSRDADGSMLSSVGRGVTERCRVANRVRQIVLPFTTYLVRGFKVLSAELRRRSWLQYRIRSAVLRSGRHRTEFDAIRAAPQVTGYRGSANSSTARGCRRVGQVLAVAHTTNHSQGYSHPALSTLRCSRRPLLDDCQGDHQRHHLRA